MGNRVEDLETQVAQLQAAVDGLTEELVETKERLRQLESATELDPSTETESAHAEFVANGSSTEGAEQADGSGTPTSGPAEAEGASDEANPEESEDGTDDGEGSEESDDIIVA